jgi:hypothetical protein
MSCHYHRTFEILATRFKVEVISPLFHFVNTSVATAICSHVLHLCAATFTLAKLHSTVVYLYSSLSVILLKFKLLLTFNIRKKILTFYDDILVLFV